MKWINTKVVINIESNEVIEKHGFFYDGKLSLVSSANTIFAFSSEGCILGRHDLTTVSPAMSGFDWNGCGHGSRLQLDGISAATPRIRYMQRGGTFGLKVLTDGTVVSQYFAPVDWTDFQEGYDDTAPVPPPVVTGRIFKLAGEGGGLAGPSRGLAGDTIQQEVNKDVSR